MSEDLKTGNKANSSMKKFYVILVTLIILLIPMAIMNKVVDDRESYRNEAVRDVAASWADIQDLSYPQMTVNTANTIERSLEIGEYNVNVNVNTELRKKGIFKVPVYTADVTIKGVFLNNYGKIENKKAVLSFNVYDSRGFVEQPKFKLMNDNFVSTGDNKLEKYISVSSKEIPFAITYKLRGLKEINVMPGGINNNITISGNWADPSFKGDFLPVKREVSKDGFKAEWSVPKIATASLNENKGCGVSLLMPVDNYRMTVRAVKYAFLFLSLTFLSFFIFEITSKERKSIHPLQYMLMGGSMLIFYLLLVSISEFTAFLPAYLISAVMTISLISLYTYFVITKKQNKMFALLITFILAVLYTFLYVLLMLQDLSLILGSLGLFITIALIMYATRDVEWYKEEN